MNRNNLFGVFNGISADSREKVVSLIDSLTDREAQVVLDAIANADKPFVGTNIASGRSEYISRLAQVPSELAKDLTDGKQQLVDSEIYTVIALGASATSLTDLFAQDGAKTVALRNVSNQKLDAGKYFLALFAEILYGIDASASGKAATFTTAVMPAALFNGEVELLQNGRTIIEKQSMHLFWNGVAAGADVSATATFFQGRTIARLENPKWLWPQEEIKGRMEWGAAPGATNSYIKFRLIGVSNVRA